MGRTRLLVGDEKIEILKKSNVLIVGLGGVGSYAAEAIARSGIGKMTIVDGDTVDPTNRNRQLPALFSTHGLYKADLMAQRILDINPEIQLTTINDFLTPEKMEELMKLPFDYTMDCIDSVTPKLTMISSAYRNGKRIVSSMGAGGKVDPTLVRVADLSETYVCKLAFYVRKRLKKYGISKGVKAVFSPEPVVRESLMLTDGSNFKASAYGTISYLPAVFGLTCASVVIRDICEIPLHTKIQESKNLF